MDTFDTPNASRAQSWARRFFLAPVSGRTYLNLLYLALAFPLGLAYFVFLSVGLSVGLGLTIVWVGIPILALVLAGTWGAAALERQMAIHLLGAEVAPMVPRASLAAEAPGLWARLRAVLANPVTWKGMGFLAIKFPLGIFTFVALVTLLSLSLALIATPFFYAWSPPQIFLWEVDTLDQALVCSLIGLATLLVSLNALNLLAGAWKWLSRVSLGSERFSAPPASPTYPAAPPAELAPA